MSRIQTPPVCDDGVLIQRVGERGVKAEDLVFVVFVDLDGVPHSQNL